MFCLSKPVNKILVLIAYVKMPLINVNGDISSIARDLKFGLSIHLHPYFVYAISEGSGDSAHMRRIAFVCTAR